jgi:hypothetical protein
MISPRQLVTWFTSTCKPGQTSRNQRMRRNIVVETLETRTSLSSLPAAAPLHGALFIDLGAAHAAAAHIQTLLTHGSVALTPDDTGPVGPKDPGGVEL